MSDLIDRQAAIARAVPLDLFGREVMMVSVSELENLPSAQPEPHEGHWIDISDLTSNILDYTDIPFMSEEELKENGIKVNCCSEKPNNSGLRKCPFCDKAATVRMTNHRVVNTPNGINPYFAATYTLGCFDCGVKFSYESKFELNNTGTVTITQDGYKEAAAKWNRRGEE